MVEVGVELEMGMVEMGKRKIALAEEGDIWGVVVEGRRGGE